MMGEHGRLWLVRLKVWVLDEDGVVFWLVLDGLGCLLGLDSH